MSSILTLFFFFTFELTVFVLTVAGRMCSKVVCKSGKFTIRDAILFHKFCIFNKEYFVFLAHRIFGFSLPLVF